MEKLLLLLFKIHIFELYKSRMKKNIYHHPIGVGKMPWPWTKKLIVWEDIMTNAPRPLVLEFFDILLYLSSYRRGVREGKYKGAWNTLIVKDHVGLRKTLFVFTNLKLTFHCRLPISVNTVAQLQMHNKNITAGLPHSIEKNCMVLPWKP